MTSTSGKCKYPAITRALESFPIWSDSDQGSRRPCPSNYFGSFLQVTVLFYPSTSARAFFFFFWRCRLSLCRCRCYRRPHSRLHSVITSPLLPFSLMLLSSSSLVQPSHALWCHAAVAMPPLNAFPALPPLSLSVSMGHAGVSEIFFGFLPLTFLPSLTSPCFLHPTRH
jgi:hypothetical protein